MQHLRLSNALSATCSAGIGQHQGWPEPHILYIYIWCIYGIFSREINKHTVMYGVCIRCVYTTNFGQPCPDSTLATSTTRSTGGSLPGNHAQAAALRLLQGHKHAVISKHLCLAGGTGISSLGAHDVFRQETKANNSCTAWSSLMHCLDSVKNSKYAWTLCPYPFSLLTGMLEST